MIRSIKQINCSNRSRNSNKLKCPPLIIISVIRTLTWTPTPYPWTIMEPWAAAHQALAWEVTPSATEASTNTSVRRCKLHHLNRLPSQQLMHGFTFSSSARSWTFLTNTHSPCSYWLTVWPPWAKSRWISSATLSQWPNSLYRKVNKNTKYK